MKSSLAPQHGPRLHDHLARKPLNGLTDVMVQPIDVYDPANDGFYLSLVKQSQGDSISLDLRRMAVRMIMEGLARLQANQRNGEWAPRAIGWTGKLDPEHARPVLQQIREERKLIFFRAWPRKCRDLAAEIMASLKEEGQSGGT
jgi:hypothetical protein